MIASGPDANRPPHIWFEDLFDISLPFGGFMRLTGLTVLYTALAIGANASFVSAQDFSSLADLKTGDMKKLVLHSDAKPVAQTVFFDESGTELTLSDFQGKTTVLNLWATWCAPCRYEMPSLSELQAALGSDDFQVVTIATMRNSSKVIDAFFDEINVENLPKHQDPKGALARSLFVAGLPATLLIDEDGNEIGRLVGDANWSSPDALSMVGKFIELDQTN